MRWHSKGQHWPLNLDRHFSKSIPFSAPYGYMHGARQGSSPLLINPTHLYFGT